MPEESANSSREQKLEIYNIMDTPREPQFDRLTRLAALICDAPISLITILDDSRQWFKSKVGLDIDETPIEYAFCNHAIKQSDIFEIPDATQDERFAQNPLVTSAPDIRFYAGCPLIDPSNNFALGTLCVIDTKPRRLNDKQREALQLLGEEAMELIKRRAHRTAYEAFFKLAPAMLCMVNSEGKFLQVSPAWETALHFKPEELIGKNIMEFIHPDDLAPTRAAMAMLNQGLTISDFVNRYRTREGDYRILQWNARAVEGLIFAASKDITAERRAQENMRLSEERYRTLTELVSDYVYIARIEGERVCLEWASDNIARVTGYSLEEMMIGETWKSIVHPEDIARINPNARRLNELVEKTSEYRIITKSGEVRWVRDTNRIINRESAEKGRIIGATKDITKEKEAEIALRHAKELLEQTGRAARIGTWEFDVAHNQLFWSDITRMLHEAPPDYQPDVKTAIEFYKAGESRQKITEVVNKAINEGIPYDLELEIITATQKNIWIRTIGIPEFKNGKCVRLYGAFQDIDEQKRLQIALQQSKSELKARNSQLEQLIELTKRQNERLKEYTYITSHNLRSSVANILSLADLLYAMPYDAQMLEMLQTSAKQLDNTIHKMNLLLDVDNMAETHEKQPVLLLEAVKENVELLRNRFTDNARVNVSVPAQLTVRALPAYIDSILHNLISNALKYRRADVICQVDIKAYESDDFIIIEVADNGIGMDLEKDGDKLFRMSSRLHTDKDGKGLGLYLTKHQIETMGGKIEVESVLGKGSVFRVYLPKS